MKKILLSNLILIIIIIFGSSIVSGQDQTIYSMRHLRQSISDNPARQHPCRVYVGLPGISSEYLNIENTGFTYNDFNFTEIPGAPDTANYRVDYENFYNALRPVNHFNFENQINLLEVGFVVRDYHITLGASNKIVQRFSYPQSMFDIKDGTYYEDGHPLSFTNIGEDFTVYNEFKLGVSKEIIPGLVVGMTLKYLVGLVNFHTKTFNLDWYTSTSDTSNYHYTINTQFDFRSSSPVIWEPIFDEQGLPTGIESPYPLDDPKELKTFMQESLKDSLKSYLFPKNRGLGIDLGVVYKINKSFTVSASVIDLGYIKWKNNAKIISTENSDFIFEGLDPAKYINTYGIAMSIKDKDIRDSIIGNFQNDIIDTLMALSNPEIKNEAYKTRLNTKIYLGANYSPTEWFDVGLLYRAYFYKTKMHNALTLSANANFWKGWSFALSYTMQNYSYNNIGIGMAYKVGPMQLYLVTDNIALPVFATNKMDFANKWMKGTKQYTMHFGFNLYFGCKDKRDFGLID